jgi:multiple sugar transport system permease protein
VSATVELSRTPAVAARRRLGARRSRYLLGAVCVAISTVMLLPLVVSALASVKPTAEAAASPPTYLPHALSLDSYGRFLNSQLGFPS